MSLSVERLDPQIEIVGPEGVPLSFPRASVFERLTAFVVDMALMYLTIIAIVICALVLTGTVGFVTIFAVALVVVFLLQHGYFIFFETRWHGATPGKRLMRLRVIARDGAGLDMESVIARNVMRDVELFLPLALLTASEQIYGRSPWWMILPALAWLGIMMGMPFLSRERTRIGDLAGGTIVVRVPKAELIRDEARTSLAPEAPDLAFTRAQLDVYGERELETLAELLRKRDYGKASIEDLRVVSHAIARKISFSGPEPNHEPERFLRTFYREQRNYLERKLLYGKRKSSKNDG